MNIGYFADWWPLSYLRNVISDTFEPSVFKTGYGPLFLSLLGYDVSNSNLVEIF